MRYVLQFLIALLLSFLVSTPTAWIERTHDGDFVLACGDDDGAEIACDAGLVESCE